MPGSFVEALYYRAYRCPLIFKRVEKRSPLVPAVRIAHWMIIPEYRLALEVNWVSNDPLSG